MTAVATPPAAAPVADPAAAVVEPAAPVAPPVVPPVAPVAPVVPEKYTLTLPEKALFDAATLDRLAPVLKDLKVPDDATGQKVVNALHAEAAEVIRVYEAARAPNGELHKAMVAGYTKDGIADPFLGNGSEEAFNALAQKAGEMLDQYGPEFKEDLKASGYAVKASFLRMMKRLAADGYGEQGMARGGATVTPGRAMSLFPDGVPEDKGANTAL